ncbi:ABC transporter substrate-binding protein [Psychrobacter sp.]|uniref:ABC transporter substrate-binding protein n=1 Tax=Psychrobacter sp. TaxID=56811 RepID=UPI003F996961
MSPVFYTSKTSVPMSKSKTMPVLDTIPVTILKWMTLALCLVLTACDSTQTPQENIEQVDESQSVDTVNNGSAQSPSIQIVSPDWGNAATLTAMGYPPIATGDARVWHRWVGSPELPPETIDLGIRYQPNAELIAQLPVDLVIDNPFYEHARNLYGDVPAESVLFAAKGDIAQWSDYTAPTRELGELIDNPKMAENYISQSEKDITLAGEQLQQRYPNVKKFAVVQFDAVKKIRMYVANSLFRPALTGMGKELDTLGEGNQWGFMSVRMGDLAALDDDTCLLVVNPVSPITRAEIEDSLVWQRLGYGSDRCVGELPPVWIYGGMSSLVSLADNLSNVSLEGGAAS